MSTEDTAKPYDCAKLPALPVPIVKGDYTAGDMLAYARAAVAAANARWESALGAVMPADFKCWHQNAKSELPEIAAGVIENLRQQAADAWEQGAAAVAKERERRSEEIETLRFALAAVDKHSVNTLRANSTDTRDWADDVAFMGKLARGH